MSALTPDNTHMHSIDRKSDLYKKTRNGATILSEDVLFPAIKKSHAHTRGSFRQLKFQGYPESATFGQESNASGFLRDKAKDFSTLSSYNPRDSSTLSSHILLNSPGKYTDKAARKSHLAKSIRSGALENSDSLILPRADGPTNNFAFRSSALTHNASPLGSNSTITSNQHTNPDTSRLSSGYPIPAHSSKTKEQQTPSIKRPERIAVRAKQINTYEKHKGKDSDSNSNLNSRRTRRRKDKATGLNTSQFEKSQGSMNDDGITSTTIRGLKKSMFIEPGNTSDTPGLPTTPKTISSSSGMKTPGSLAENSIKIPSIPHQNNKRDSFSSQSFKKHASGDKKSNEIELIDLHSSDLDIKTYNENVLDCGSRVSQSSHPRSFDENAFFTKYKLNPANRYRRLTNTNSQSCDQSTKSKELYQKDETNSSRKDHSKIPKQRTVFKSEQTCDNNYIEPEKIKIHLQNYNSNPNPNLKHFNDETNTQKDRRLSHTNSSPQPLSHPLSLPLPQPSFQPYPQSLPQSSPHPLLEASLQPSNSRTNNAELMNNCDNSHPSAQNSAKMQPAKFESKQTIHNNYNIAESHNYNEHKPDSSNYYVMSKQIRVKRIRVQRDYSFEECCQFYTQMPDELLDKVSTTDYNSFITKLNEMLADAEGTALLNFVEGLLTCLSLYLYLLVTKSHYQKVITKISSYIEESNHLIFNPAGYAVLNPRQTAFTFLEVVRI